MPAFVLIGHCGPDAYLLKSAISRAVPGAVVASAADERSLQAHMQPQSVLLINRVLDGFDADGGVELIERLARRQPRPVMMLISNVADAQARAVAAGAVPGFGKRDINKPLTAETLRAAAAATAATSTSNNASRWQSG